MVTKVACQSPTPRIPEDRLGERVVHHRVKTVAGEPRIGTLPNLTNGVRLRINRANTRAELLPEALIIDLFWHVESPAVGAETNPELGRLQQMLARLCIANVDLRKRRELPPRLIPNACFKTARDTATCATALLRMPLRRLWVGNQRAIAAQERLIGIEPIHIGRLRAVLKHMMKRPKAATGVIENAVENDAHPARVRRIEQFTKRLVTTEHRIYVEVVVRVIAMV